jgi:excisionase family DNA binding protein
MPNRLLRGYSASQVAELLAVSPRTVQRWFIEEDLPYVKIGHTARILEADLRAFLRQHTQNDAGLSDPLDVALLEDLAAVALGWQEGEGLLILRHTTPEGQARFSVHRVEDASCLTLDRSIPADVSILEALQRWLDYQPLPERRQD